MYRDLLAEQRNTIVGIDLGTTNSLIAVATDCSARILQSPEGKRSLPSVAGIDDQGTIILGDAARAMRVVRPESTISSIKRFMGMDAKEAESHGSEVAYTLKSEDERVASVELGDKSYSAPEVSALYLKELKRWAEHDLGKSIAKAVITVPAYFNDAQRQATRDAGRIAGLEVLRIVNEPTAAALAYGLQHKQEGYVAVYDFGGGTFDVSILRITDGVFEVLATGGDTRLGGDDIDWALAAKLFAMSGANDDLANASAELKQTFISAAEHAKIELSTNPVIDVTIQIPGKGEWITKLTREELETLAAPSVEKTLKLCRDVLKSSGITIDKLDEVLLVGGSSRMPYVQRQVAEVFGRVPRYDIDPEDVVALGAAVQARILAGGLDSMLLLDVTPLSLGIETWGGAYDVIIGRNTTLPTRASQEFTTNVEGQTKVAIHVLQGEREMAEHNRSLARFELSGIPPMPAGEPRIEVIYEIDANGILNVSAKEHRSNTLAQIEVTPSSGLNEDDVQRMIRESFENADQDLKQRIMLDRRTDAKKVLTSIDKALEQSSEIIEDDYRCEVESARDELQAAYDKKDADALKATLTKVNAVTEKLAELQMNALLSETVKGKTLDEATR